ncbi:tetratricopeptide repeat protein [Oxalobacteraceae bacterium CAVE-383]|nr:tetratricopeptide repeat protein [Oxalobacteraceae bacterium CAVE-383]
MSKQKPVPTVASVRSAAELYESGKLNKAKRILLQCLEESPQEFEALRLLGFIAGRQNEYASSAQYLQRAVEIRPTFTEGWYYLGKCFEQLKKLENAVVAYDKAIQLYPDFFEAHHDRGHACFNLRRFDDAISSLAVACKLLPASADSWLYLGAAYGEKNNHAAAIECLERVLILSPQNLIALGSLANAYAALSMHVEAVRVYEKMLVVNPDEKLVRGYIFYIKMYLADWSDYEAEKQFFTDEAGHGAPRITPFIAAAISDSPKLQLQIASRHGAAFRQKPIEKRQHDKPHDKIRLAYLSSDYHAHATSVLMLDILKNHDRDKFEVMGISFGLDQFSDLTKDIRSSFDQFIDVKGKTNHEAAALLRDLEIDIAVDLKGYTFNARPEILAYRPAPIQVNYLGYPGTMGVDFIDYLIADKFVIPEDEQAFYSESIVTLPGSYQPNGRNRPASATATNRKAHGLPESGIVFCSFNSPYKNNPATFDLWMALLRKVENSVLWLLSESKQFEANLCAEAASRGIDSSRLVFAGKVRFDAHLARFSLADIFLDSLPYGAHTTASDALWANVPVVTCVGSTFPGRVGQSVLEALEMPELITHSLPEYFDLAYELATDPEMLRDIREKIAGKVKTSRLFDARRYTKELEQAYSEMVKIHQAGNSPRNIIVPDLLGE